MSFPPLPPETPQNPSANWYPDPSDPGQLRYWDGSQWTANVAPVGAGATRTALPLGPGGRPYAGFWRRFFGLTIDGLLLAIPMLILLANALRPAIADMTKKIEALGPNPTPDQINNLSEQLTNSIPVTALAGITLISAALNLLYFGIALHVWGRTIGGLAVGIRCVDENGNNPTWGASFLREGIVAGFNLAAAIPFVGFIAAIGGIVNYLSMLRDPKRQAWMDKAAGTYVVRN